ncbi:MAG: type IX secretion system sortase PorU [Prevotella sp.]|jgi:hypothetical protein|nr:type IX secretion system sortase PorU [Prevotella sp.]
MKMKQQVLNNKYLFHAVVVLLLLLNQTTTAAQNNGSRYARSSVLSSGNWFKIKIGTTGVYKLSYSDLKNMGISEPKNVQIYGYGGWILDEDFTKPYIDDLPQVAVWMSKPRAEFREGDYILFYGRGDIKWTYDPNKNEFVQTQNPYSSDSYYFVTEAEAGPLLMDELASAGVPATTVSTFTDYFLHEKELVNIEQTGREYYGENFMYAKSQNFELKLPGVTAAPAMLRYALCIKMQVGNTAVLDIKYNNRSVGGKTFSYYGDDYRDINDTLTIANLSETGTLNVDYTLEYHTTINAVYLNYLKLEYTRRLKPYGGVTLFRSKVQDAQLGYVISEATDKVVVFDVTNAVTPQIVKADLSGSELKFTASNIGVREYAMVNTASSGDIPVPTLVGKVDNQNLHSLDPKDMVIIVRSFLKNYAEQLAEIHKKDSGLESVIVTAEDIYNEFSSGKPDVTAYRRFLKMFYDRDANTSPRYLMLFGCGTYDNRFIDNTWSETQKKSLLLTYQTVVSLTESSAVIDDYIGFLDDAEAGTVSLGNSTLDIGIGRLPVRNETDARNAVTKIKDYIENKNKGFWKNNVAFLADDAIGHTSDEIYHCTQSDAFAETIKRNYPAFVVNKLYEDNYDRVVTSGGARYPDATKALLNKLNSGLLMLNYMGHGAARTLSHEYVLIYSDFQAMANKYLPIWITATCSFSRFDAYAQSAGEIVFLNPKGGGIALISTTRTVYSSLNERLNRYVLNHLFEKENGKPLRLGDVLRRAKIDIASNDYNKLNFVLLGDPAMRLSYPGDDYRVEIRKVNGMDATGGDIKIQALADNRIKGVIVNSSGDIATDFTGKIEAVIFDSEQTLKTRGNKLPSENGDMTVTFKDYPNTLYSGNTSVTNGEFEIEFVTPLDILYADAFGKMSFYAYDNAGNEAQGSFLNYKVGGMAENEIETNPPVIRELYLNKETFRSGGNVNMTPMFHAEIYDDSGINLSSSIGHNISLVIDGLKAKTYNLSSNFQNKDLSAGETGALGAINFMIPELEEGKHTLQFRVWDVFNNSTTETLDFECVEDYTPTIFKFEILGNPARTSTEFVFYSDLSGSNVIVEYEVYSMTGALQWRHEETGIVDYSSGYRYQWDLTASSGGRLLPGVYICRMSVSVDGKVKTSKSEKLIVTGQ